MITKLLEEADGRELPAEEQDRVAGALLTFLSDVEGGVTKRRTAGARLTISARGAHSVSGHFLFCSGGLGRCTAANHPLRSRLIAILWR